VAGLRGGWAVVPSRATAGRQGSVGPVWCGHAWARTALGATLARPRPNSRASRPVRAKPPSSHQSRHLRLLWPAAPNARGGPAPAWAPARVQGRGRDGGAHDPPRIDPTATGLWPLGWLNLMTDHAQNGVLISTHASVISTAWWPVVHPRQPEHADPPGRGTPAAQQGEGQPVHGGIAKVAPRAATTGSDGPVCGSSA